ncbi:MAG: glyceraldehyde 3-phosphate dehydrogenase [Candidatus Woesearchaeota archaeon]|jgi:glyceraldehyde 3-phosphate dehydrogenase
MVRVAINGFGRIGRTVFRIMQQCPDIEVVAINDLTDTKTLAHLLKYDTVHGRFAGQITHDENALYIDGKELVVLAERNPSQLPWAFHNIDVVIESTGFFTKREGAQKHLDAGAKKVLISGPSPDCDLVIVKGINEHQYDRNVHHIVSNASCTTNCLAPVVKVLHDNFRIKRGYMTTVHSYTGDQRLVDAPHKDLRRARSAACNIVPTTTGAAKAVTQVIPELAGKLDGIAIRVPTADGSVIDFVCELEAPVTKEIINDLFRNVAAHQLQGVLEYTEDPLVSSDVIGNPHSSVFDAQMTHVMDDGRFIKVVSWYDNEWGYSNRMVDLVRLL